MIGTVYSLQFTVYGLATETSKHKIFDLDYAPIELQEAMN
jgi:hypothetical protein